MESNKESYTESKLNGMFEVYDVFDSILVKLKDSLDNVWMIHDKADWYADSSSEEDKEKLVFAVNTLIVLRQAFQDRYDEVVDKAKAQLEEV